LAGEAAAYFCELVRFTQSKGSTARADHYAKLIGFRHYREVMPLAAAEAAYHANWYLPAVRELAARRDFKATPSWIAKALWPNISEREAAHALEVLLELKLLVRDGKRVVQGGDSVVSTGAEAQSVNVASFHRAMLARAAAAIDEVPADSRDISSLTLCLGADGLRLFKERIRRFRRELLELSTLESDPEQVVQLNFQLFPLSHPKAES
jgi:uncharacterized protein (TIGR02147 family)